MPTTSKVDPSLLLDLNGWWQFVEVMIYFVDEDVLYRRYGRIDEVSQFVSHRYFLDWTIMLRQVYGPIPGRVGIDLVYLGPLHFYYQFWVETDLTDGRFRLRLTLCLVQPANQFPNQIPNIHHISGRWPVT